MLAGPTNGFIQPYNTPEQTIAALQYHPSSPRHNRTHSQPEITPRPSPTFPRIRIHNFEVIHQPRPRILHIAARDAIARVNAHRHSSRLVQIQHQRRLKRVLWPHACRHGGRGCGKGIIGAGAVGDEGRNRRIVINYEVAPDALECELKVAALDDRVAAEVAR